MTSDKKFAIRVRGVILDGDGALLVVKHATKAQFAALPGGHLEWSEDIKGCLERELVEELGVKPEIGRLLYINNFTEGDVKQSIEFIFEILNSNDYKDISNLQRTHAHEIAEVCWLATTDTMALRPAQIYQDFKEGKILSDEVRYISI